MPLDLHGMLVWNWRVLAPLIHNAHAVLARICSSSHWAFLIPVSIHTTLRPALMISLMNQC